MDAILALARRPQIVRARVLCIREACRTAQELRQRSGLD
jgi:hypothetical protein